MRNLSFVLLAFLSLPGLAAESALVVSAPYVRQAPPGARVSAAFMTISNPGREPRRLARAQSPLVKAIELHTHRMQDGIMQMRQIASIEIPAAGAVEFKPGGYHLMLFDVKAGLKEGDTLPITLFFDDASTKRVLAPVRRDTPTVPGAAAPAVAAGAKP